MELLPLRELKPLHKNSKAFSNRSVFKNKTSFTKDYIQAKQKAYERYKEIYPVHDKENLYPTRKIPAKGYFIMKGYRPQLAEKNQQHNREQQTYSSDRLVNNIVKKYLLRKHQKENTIYQPLPKIDHALSTFPDQNQVHKKKNKERTTRALTEVYPVDSLYDP